jgi:hypothetical protein
MEWDMSKESGSDLNLDVTRNAKSPLFTNCTPGNGSCSENRKPSDNRTGQNFVKIERSFQVKEENCRSQDWNTVIQ